METAYRRCCGMDVHKKSVVVHVMPAQGRSDSKALGREFRTFSRDLRSLRGWLKSCRVTDVVMESTGQYWRAVWNILEEPTGPRLVLVNPAHIKALAGRKTDRIDARRLAHYLANGELNESFVPPRDIRELRDLTRWRVHLLEEVNRVKNRIGQMCEAGNIKVSSVASDLFGLSGRRMLQAIVEGTRDAGWMADYACGRLRTKRRELAQALDGTFTEHQRWMLGEELQHLAQLETRVAKATEENAERMVPYLGLVRRLTTIPGVDRLVAWTIVAELGPDMSVFPDAAHVAGWSGVCPGNKVTGGKRLSGRTRKANPYLRRALAEAAWGASHTKNCYLAALYRRLKGRLGHNKAIFALAHQILLVAYTMLRKQEDYRELGGDYYDRLNRPRTIRRLVARLTRLGYDIELKPKAEAPPEAPAEIADGAPPAAPPQRRGRPCKCLERGIPCPHRSFIDASTAQTTENTSP